MSNTMPKGDTWVLKDNNEKSVNYSKNFIFDFTNILYSDIKIVVKSFIWSRYRKGSFSLETLYNNLLNFHCFMSFAEINNLTSLRDLDNNGVSQFISYLKTTKSPNTNKVLSYGSQSKRLSLLKSIVHHGHLYLPTKTPDNEFFVGKEFRGVNRKLRIEYIPDKIVNLINQTLINENNLFLKYGIIILQSTGMRIMDLLLLKVNCLGKHPISGHDTITYYDHKNRKKHDYVPISPHCSEAIRLLQVHRLDILDKYLKSPDSAIDKELENLLFIYVPEMGKCSGQLIKISYNIMRPWLKKFISDNNINDANGKPYNLNSHQFRRTLGTDMHSKGIEINIIQKVLGHSFATTTNQYYVDAKDKERAEVSKSVGIIGIIEDINSISEDVIQGSEELEWFKQNMHKGARMCDGYCTKPFKEGQLCEHLKKRKKCYTCSRYITTPEYLKFHKAHLEALEVELANNIYGEHYANHIIPTIAVLKEIIKRLEEIKCPENISNYQ